MKPIVNAALIGFAFLTSTASMAQLANFTGPEIGANLAISQGQIKFKNSSIQDTSQGVALHAGYGLEANDDTLFMFGLDYNLGNVAIGSGSQEFSENSVKIYYKNPYGLSAGLGRLINDTTLAFAKLSYEATSFAGDGQFQEVKLRGYGLSAGARYIFQKNTYLQGELKHIRYTKAINATMTDEKPYTLQLNVGLGYQF